MSQQKEFEGSDVRALLDEICATYGPDPSIARAETFRTGGILGFFQRERYRLVVDGEPASQAAQTRPAEVLSVEASAQRPASPGLAQAAYAAIAGGVPNVSAVSVMDRPTVALATEQPRPAPATPVLVEATMAEDAFASLAEATEDSFVPTRAAATSGPAAGATSSPELVEEFESVLRRVANIVAEPAAIAPDWPQIDRASRPDVVTGAELLDRLGTQVTRDEPAPATTPVPAPPAAHVNWTVADAPGDPDIAPADVTPADEVPPGATEEGVELRLALDRVGFGPEMVSLIERAATGADLEETLLEAFRSVPPPPRLPERKGSLIVVVGPGSRVLEEAGRLAAQAGADPSSVAFASERGRPRSIPSDLMIRTSEDAGEMAPGHRRGKVGVVAVDAPVGGRSTAWATQIVTALRPTMVIGVVDAMYKNEDVDAWASDLGGIDALAVDNLELTSSPAALLDLEIPVARIADQPATPLRWTSVIVDRIVPAGTGRGPARAGVSGRP